MPLSLRRGRVTAIRERHDELVRLEVDGDRLRRLSVGDGAGRARGRGARQRAGARARARLGRLRRALREPDARARARGRGGRARDGAAVHAAPARAPVTSRRRASSRRTPARDAGRLLLAAQPGRAGVRGARGPARRVRPARRRRAAGVALGHGTGAARARACRRRRRRSRRASTATCSASRPPRRSRGPAARARRRRLLDRPGDRRDRDALRARRACRCGSRQRGACARRLAGRSPCGSRPPTSGDRHRGGLAPHRGRARRSCAARRWSAETARAGARPARACRSRTWAAAPTTTRSSSPPPTPRASRAREARCSAANARLDSPLVAVLRFARPPPQGDRIQAGPHVSVTLRAGGVPVLPQLDVGSAEKLGFSPR